jgi:hypothetical protein
MTELDQKQLGKTLWNIADALAGVGFINLPDGLRHAVIMNGQLQRKNSPDGLRRAAIMNECTGQLQRKNIPNGFNFNGKGQP